MTDSKKFTQAAAPNAGEAQACMREEPSQRLRPNEWKGGNTIWLMDLIFPYGGLEEPIQEVRTQVFPGKTLKALQPAPDGKSLAVVEW
ncbi:MAG: toxin-activating lysine-acyltransferase [Rhodovibrionaceae bacterium]